MYPIIPPLKNVPQFLSWVRKKTRLRGAVIIVPPPPSPRPIKYIFWNFLIEVKCAPTLNNFIPQPFPKYHRKRGLGLVICQPVLRTQHT